MLWRRFVFPPRDSPFSAVAYITERSSESLYLVDLYGKSSLLVERDFTPSSPPVMFCLFRLPAGEASLSSVAVAATFFFTPSHHFVYFVAS